MTISGDRWVAWSWHADAACRGYDLDLFFPVADEEAACAKAICSGCAARIDCLSFALGSGQRYGVWGGLSEKERARLVRRDARPAAGMGVTRAATG